MRTFRRLTRVPILLAAIAASAALITVIGLAIVPHSREALFAVDRERSEVELNLSPGAARTEGDDTRLCICMQYSIVSI